MSFWNVWILLITSHSAFGRQYRLHYRGSSDFVNIYRVFFQTNMLIYVEYMCIEFEVYKSIGEKSTQINLEKYFDVF